MLFNHFKIVEGIKIKFGRRVDYFYPTGTYVKLLARNKIKVDFTKQCNTVEILKVTENESD